MVPWSYDVWTRSLLVIRSYGNWIGSFSMRLPLGDSEDLAIKLYLAVINKQIVGISQYR